MAIVVAGGGRSCGARFSFLRNAVRAEAATETIGETGRETTGAAATLTTASDGVADDEVTEGCAVQSTGSRWMGIDDLR